MTRRTSAARGQSVVLFALCCFAMALAVISMMALGSAYRDKMTAQNAADSAAYSLAVQQARTLNYFALTNRTSIAHEVAMMSIYGHASFMTYYWAAVEASKENWQDNVISASTCCGCVIPGTPPVCCLEPCCILRGGMSAPCCAHIRPFNNYVQLYSDERNRLDQLGWKPDGDLDKAINVPADLNISLDVGRIVFIEQTKMDTTMKGLMSNQTMADQIAAHFESQPNAQDRVHAPSSSAISNGNLTMWKKSVKAPPDGYDGVPGYVMAAHSARPDQTSTFLTDRKGISPYCGMYPMKLFTECGGTSLDQGIYNLTQGWTGESKSMPNSSDHDTTLDGDESTVGSYRAAAHDYHGTVRSFSLPPANGDNLITCNGWASAPGAIGRKPHVWIQSTPRQSGAEHNWSYGSDGSADSNHPVGGCSGGTCGAYTNSAWFRTADDGGGNTSWYTNHPTQNMPRVLALTVRDFNGPGQKEVARPWELCGPDRACQMWTPAGIATFDVRAAARSAPITGLAMGLAYYHRADDWTEVPNLLNPFWRAKLHKLSSGEGDQPQCKNAADDGVCWQAITGGITGETGSQDQANVLNALPIPF